MKKILFATTNQGKLNEAKEILAIEVEGIGMEIDEIQSLSPEDVAQKKAWAYFEKLKTPLVVEDLALSFSALNGLPGTYIKDFDKALGNDGLVKLLENHDDRSAEAKTVFVYIDEKGKTHTFEGTVKGFISNEVRGDKGFGWDPIFIPEGNTKTFGEMEMDEKNKYSMRSIALQKLADFLKTQQ